MLVEDPKDRHEEPDDVDLEDDAEAVEDEPEDKATEDEPADDEVVDEPSDEAEEKPQGEIRLTREEYDRLKQGEGRRTPPTERPDPLVEAYAEMLKDEKIPLSLKKVVGGLAARTAEAVEAAERAKQETRQLQSIPPKARARVQELVDRFGLPPAIAHQLHKGELYDQAVAKKRAKRTGGGEEDVVDEPVRRPTDQRGGAKHTSTVRAVRREDATSPNGKTVSVKGHPNLKIPLEFPNSTAYEKFMGALSDEDRATVFKLRRSNVAAKIRGQG